MFEPRANLVLCTQRGTLRCLTGNPRLLCFGSERYESLETVLRESTLAFMAKLVHRIIWVGGRVLQQDSALVGIITLRPNKYCPLQRQHRHQLTATLPSKCHEDEIVHTAPFLPYAIIPAYPVPD